MSSIETTFQINKEVGTEVELTSAAAAMSKKDNDLRSACQAQAESEVSDARLAKFDLGDDLFSAFVKLTGNEEIHDDVTSLMSTIGFVAALFMSFVFGRSGHELIANPSSMYGSGDAMSFAQNLYTLVCGICTLASFATAAVSSRMYIDLKMVPMGLTRAAVATMGGFVVFQLILISFFIITVTAVIAVFLHLTIMLPATMGAVAALLCVGFAGVAIATFVYVDKSCFHMVEEVSAKTSTLLKAKNRE